MQECITDVSRGRILDTGEMQGMLAGEQDWIVGCVKGR